VCVSGTHKSLRALPPLWLTKDLRVSPGAVRGEAQKGYAWLDIAVPSSPGNQRRGKEETGGVARTGTRAAASDYYGRDAPPRARR